MTIGGALSSAFLTLSGGADMMSAAISGVLGGMATLLIISIISLLFFIFKAPYSIWKRQKASIEEESESRSFQEKITPLAVSVGRLLYLVENWTKEGQSGVTPRPPPIEYSEYYMLLKVSKTLVYSDEIRGSIKEFLSFFTTSSDSHNLKKKIKTTFKTEEEAKKNLVEVKKIAQYLTDSL